MKHVTFEEYEAAKAEIIGGVQYKEWSALDGDVIHKTYTTERGTFYERNEGGRVEFWSDTHPESRIYDENERANSTDPAQVDTDAEQDDNPHAADVTPEKAPSYGRLLHDKIRTEICQYACGNRFRYFACLDKRTGQRKCPAG